MTQHWIRFNYADTNHFGTLDGEQIHVYQGDMFVDPQPTDATLKLDQVKLLMPTQPSKIIAMWNNFRALGEKLNLAVPAEPLYLIKSPNTYLDPGETIRKPSCDGRVAYEGELGIVIGKPCKEVSAENALDYVFVIPLPMTSLSPTFFIATRALRNGSVPRVSIPSARSGRWWQPALTPPRWWSRQF